MIGPIHVHVFAINSIFLSFPILIQPNSIFLSFIIQVAKLVQNWTSNPI